MFIERIKFYIKIFFFFTELYFCRTNMQVITSNIFFIYFVSITYVLYDGT